MPSKSIRSMIKEINNPDADGHGLWLPNIQRQFVWNKEQIARLCDSVMRRYPLSSMLLWRTNEPIKYRSFIQNLNGGKVDLKSHYQHNPKKLKRLVLDGQQRLQSFYLALQGCIDNEVLHLHVLSGEQVSSEEIRYRFEFKVPAEKNWPWVPLAKIIYSGSLPEDLLFELAEDEVAALTDNQRRQAIRNLSLAQREFGNDSVLLYHEIDSTQDDNALKFEDVVEVFIRANSGGTKLNKSDLMFTLLSTEWEDADIVFEDFLDKINDNERFQFSRDFLIKLSTTVLGYNAKYDVDKLRDDQVRKEISENWPDIAGALLFVKDEIVTSTYIRSHKALTSYNALIPLVYLQYHFPGQLSKSKILHEYFVPALFSGVFSGQPDSIIDKMVKSIKENEGFDIKKIKLLIETSNKYLHVNESHVLNYCGYGSGNIHLLFNIWYGREYRAGGFQHEPQIDHIFARSILKDQKELNDATGREVQRYGAWEINQLANCMLLPAHQNGAGDKGDKSVDKWLAEQSEEFLDLHCIPKTKTLWKVENYERFIDKRQQLIIKRCEELGLLSSEE